MRSVASVVSLDGFRIESEEPLLPRMNSQNDGSPDSQPVGPLRYQPDRDSIASSLRHNDLSKHALRHANDRLPGDRVRDKKRHVLLSFDVLAVLSDFQMGRSACSHRSAHQLINTRRLNPSAWSVSCAILVAQSWSWILCCFLEG